MNRGSWIALGVVVVALVGVWLYLREDAPVRPRGPNTLGKPDVDMSDRVSPEVLDEAINLQSGRTPMVGGSPVLVGDRFDASSLVEGGAS